MNDPGEGPAGADPGEAPRAEALVFLPESHGIRAGRIGRNARRVIERLQGEGHAAFIAGGAVRDLLLNRAPKDFDVVTDARPGRIRTLFRNSRTIGRRFRIVHVFFGREVVEVSTFRSRVDAEESAARHEGHVFRVRGGMLLRDNVYGTPEEDAWRRDFSVNALFFDPVRETLIDHVGGLEDVKAGRLRVLGDPARRMIEDPVRMLRAVRFAAALGFRIDDPAQSAIASCADRLASASPARLYDEMQKLFFCGEAVRVLEWMESFRLLDVLFPDLAAWAAADEAGRQWLKRVARQVDIWRRAGHGVRPELFLALFCGPFHEARAEADQAAGVPASVALERAARRHLQGLSGRVSIPRMAACHAARILAAQPRLRNPPVRRMNRFVESAGFHDAFIYFKMSARFTGRYSGALEWWERSLGSARDRDAAAGPGPGCADP